MRMDLAGERFQVEAGYTVELPPGDHLIVIAGNCVGEPAYDFDHINLAARKSEVFEFKHYRKSGSKFWTSKAGMSFYFVLPKAHIELLPEKGYSYVPVIIQGQKHHLNVSGIGGSEGWRDCVHRVVNIGCGWSLKRLRSLALIAVKPDECRRQGIDLDIKPLDEHEHNGFVDRAAASVVPSRLKVDSQLYLRAGFSFADTQGPFAVETRPHRQRHFVCTTADASLFHVPYSVVDWPRTAAANNVRLPQPVFDNRIAADVPTLSA